MSGTFVPTATRASEKIAYFLTDDSNKQNVTVSTITARSGTFTNISTQNIEITSGKVGMGAGKFISTIGNELYYWDGFELEQLTSVSSISSLGEWSLEPAISDVNLDGNNIINVNTLECGNVSSLMGEFTSLYAKDFTAETVTVLSTIQTINYISTTSVLANSGRFNTISSGNAYIGNLSGNVANFNTISSGSINVPGFNTSSISVQNLSAITGYIQALNVSSINGSEFTSNTVTVSSINTSQIIAQNVSSATATLAQAFLSTMSFNPSFSGNLGPNISVDMGMGDFVGSVLGGLIGVGVTVPAGIFAIIGGLVSLIAPRPINNINSNVYEQINMTTQLQVSTLGQQFSTIFRGLSSTVSTISGSPQTVNFEVFTSTISSPPPVVAMRSVGDPLQLVSTPWTEYQAFSQWVEIPSGSIGSNVSVSTLTLLQSTILRSEPTAGGILQVLEAQNPSSYGQVEAQSYFMGGAIGGSNGILYYQDLLDRPGFLDNTATAHTLAYLTDVPGAQNLSSVLATGNNAGANDIDMNGNDIQATSTHYVSFIRPNVAIDPDVDIQSVAGIVNVQAPDVSVVATTGTVFINSQSQYVEVENLQFSITGAPATGTTITTANSGRDINIATVTTGDFNVTTGGNPRLQIDGATNGNTTLTTQGTGLVQINQAGSAGGVNNPILKLQNTNAGAGGTTVEVYKVKNVAQNETIAEHLFFANDAGSQKTQFGAIKCVATNVAVGNEDGSVDIWSSVNGVQQQVFRFNGADNENNSFRPLDMNGNAITSGTSFNLQNVNSIALGSLTNVGLLGYNITSRGAGQNNLWQQSRQSLLGNYGGGTSIDDTTPTNFGVSLPIISFPLSATGRYKVTVSIGFDLQSSADLIIYPEVVYNAVTYPGAIYAPSLYVVAPHVNKGGVIHNSASFVDYFTVPISSTSIAFTVDVKVLTVSGATTTNNVRTYITVEPDFD